MSKVRSQPDDEIDITGLQCVLQIRLERADFHCIGTDWCTCALHRLCNNFSKPAFRWIGKAEDQLESHRPTVSIYAYFFQLDRVPVPDNYFRSVHRCAWVPYVQVREGFT